MKKNYERYSEVNAESYQKQTLIGFLFSGKYGPVIADLLSKIKNKKVLELGCGTGRYTKLYYQTNEVTCVDINPHLFALKDVPVIQGNVTELNSLLSKEKMFDIILSFWMTEYLSSSEVKQTLSQGNTFLLPEGNIVFTFISKGLWGRFYIAGAGIKGIRKYCYSNKQIVEISNSSGLVIEKITSIKRLGLEFGKVVVFRKK